VRAALTVVALLVLMTGACTPTPPSGAAPVAINEQTKSELEALLQRRADAMAAKNLSTFQSTYDGSRTAFRRCQEEDFQRATRGNRVGATKLAKIEAYGDRYVRGYAEESLGYARYYFRKEGNRWLLTQPKSDEIGGERKKTVEGLDISYYGIDEDIVDILARESLATREFLKKAQRGETRTPFAMRFIPTRDLAGVTACGVVGTHFVNDPRDPYLRIYSVWMAPSLTELSDFSKGVFKHEGLHWLQDQFIPGISARLDWWLTEGWPDYMAQVPRNTRTVCSTVPTFKQLVDGPPQDVDTPPEVAGQYYVFAHTMVEYVYVSFGNDAYWNLMTAYKDSVDPKVTYPQVLRVTPEKLYADWQAWSKQKYC
jgi:hypothetical protein